MNLWRDVLKAHTIHMFPEMVPSESFQQLWKVSRFRGRLTAVVVDEAHCIEERGEDDPVGFLRLHQILLLVSLSNPVIGYPTAGSYVVASIYSMNFPCCRASAPATISTIADTSAADPSGSFFVGFSSAAQYCFIVEIDEGRFYPYLLARGSLLNVSTYPGY